MLRPFQQFAQAGALSGILLLACSALALAWANSPWGDSYFALWETGFTIGPASAPLTHSLHHWINDGLMAVFFLLVGLEIKRELLVGELASVRQAALPVVAALGGMLMPAAVFVAVNRGGPGASGWAIPMATDIAFALGVLTLVGPRLPVGLKVFLAALAIADDMGAVLVIACFYSSDTSLPALAAAAAITAALVACNARGVRTLTPYLLLGGLLWLALLASGVHATIAGVILALTIPARTRVNAADFSQRARRLLDEFDRTETGDLLVLTSTGQQEAIHELDVVSDDVQGPLLRLEHALHGIVAYAIMPLFALANAGVRLGGAADASGGAITAGVALGLVLGKPLGITLFSWLALRLRWATLPAGVTLRMLHGASWLAGIGFTMSLFIAGLAYGTSSRLDAAKIGVLGGSVVAGIVGFTLLRREARHRAAPE